MDVYIDFSPFALILNVMLKAILAIFAIIGLLISPIQALAAQMECQAMAAQTMEMQGASAEMDMPCCDEGAGKTSKQEADSKACFNNCIAMFGIAFAANTYTPATSPLLRLEAIAFLASDATAVASEPGLFIPPPRSNA